MEPQTRHILRHRLSLVGWGVLLYIFMAQILGGLALLIPGVLDSDILTLLVNYLVIYVVAPVLLWLVIRKLPKGISPGLSFSPRAFARTAVFCLGVLYLFNFLTLLLVSALESLSGLSTGNLLESAAESMSSGAFLLLTCVAAPIFEELIFRRLLLDRLRPFGDRCAIWISAVAFGLFHMNLYQLFYATALGLVFAGIALKTGKLRYTILLHAIVNLASQGMSLLTELGEWGDWLATALVFLLCGLAIWIFWRYARTFRHAPPTYPVTERQVMTNLTGAPGLWVCTLLALALSVAVIFIA